VNAEVQFQIPDEVSGGRGEWRIKEGQVLYELSREKNL
jgi:hypothetical protein